MKQRHVSVTRKDISQSRLTITPERIELKIGRGPEDPEVLVEASRTIAETLEDKVAMRGSFRTRPDGNLVICMQDGRRVCAERTYRWFDFDPTGKEIPQSE